MLGETLKWSSGRLVTLSVAQCMFPIWIALPDGHSSIYSRRILLHSRETGKLRTRIESTMGGEL